MHESRPRCRIIFQIIDGYVTNVWFIKIWTTHKLSLWLFWQILILFCKFLMPRPLKWSIQGAHTIISSKNIHKVTNTDYLWFEFLWIRRYFFTWTIVKWAKFVQSLERFTFWMHDSSVWINIDYDTTVTLFLLVNLSARVTNAEIDILLINYSHWLRAK